MGRLKCVVGVLILSSCWWPPAPGRAAPAQACGCSETHVIVGNEEGEAVRGATVEFVNDGGLTVRNCAGGSPAKQSGSARKFKFTFSAWEGGPPKVRLRVTAPGYAAYEEEGAFMTGCDSKKIEVVLMKTRPSYRAQ